ncbi:hypothetical protein K492DRAFT_189177 [Lichtheimia hyalospora FSU 10163]|nr:hypothetical protein K492DRAFT_189177 [Lichtheimia hyalospora FSU 10163]
MICGDEWFLLISIGMMSLLREKDLMFLVYLMIDGVNNEYCSKIVCENSVEDYVKILRARFEASQVDSSFATLYQLIDRLVIRETRQATDNILEGLLRIARESITVSNQDVVACLSAIPATYDNTPFPQDMTVYYVRSISLTIHQLQEIIQQYQHAYSDGIFCQDINVLIQQHIRQPNTQVWVRYVGATYNATPATRLQEDLDAARAHGQRRFNNFCRIMMDMHIDEPFQVHEVMLLRTQGAFGRRGPNQELLDGTERFLIHLFGRNFLLNSQPGGYFISYQPLTQDQQIIQTINAPYAYEYLSTTRQVQVPRQEVNQGLIHLFDQYTTQLGQHDQLLANSITPQYLESVYEQVTPRAVHQFHHPSAANFFTPIVVMGKDVTRHNFTLAATFSASRAGTVTRDLIDSILSTIQHEEGEDQDHQVLLPTFFDLWPVPRHRFLWDLHIEHAARILELLRPLVLISMSYEVAKVVRSNFHGRHSLSREEYSQIAGEARIVNYDIGFDYEHEPEDVEPQEHWCVAIFHNHPGTANYGCVSPVVTRFMHLCWVRSVIVLDTCLDFLRNPQQVAGAPGSRQFAQQLLQESQDREPTDFTVSLNQARDALNAYRATDAQDKYLALARRNEGVVDVRNRGDIGAISQVTLRRRIDLWGISAPRGSQRRLQQYVTIVRHDYPDLYSSISFINDRPAFRHWFIYEMNDNVSILQSFLRHVQHETTPIVSDLPPGLVRYLLRICPRPEGWPEDDNTWVAVKELRDIAMEAARQQFVDRNGAPAGVAQDPEESRHLRNQYLASIGNVPYTLFHMCELHVGSRKARFRVLVDGQERYEPNGIYVGQAVENHGPTVYLDFDPQVSEHGLVFKNSDRQTLPLQEQPTIYYDYSLVQHSKNSYFRVFLDTLQHHNIPARQAVLEEAEFDGSFSLQRILRPYWLDVCANDHHDVYLRAGDVPANEQGAANFTTEITAYIQQHGRGIDSLVWDHYLSDPRGMTTISNAWKELLKKYQLEIEHISMVRGVKRWRLPRYPGEEAIQEARGAAGRQLRPRARSRSAMRYGRPSSYRARGSRRGTPTGD